MAKRRTNKEWQTLFEQYQSSHLSQRVFCERNGLSLSTFYAKRQQLQTTESANISGFVKAEVIEKTTRYQMAQTPVANMTLSINNVELSVPQGTPVRYLAELIGALS
ncbi:IS66 family insertion sequence element accessory protein TnpA [Vibrio aestuarianus]|uniref:IS66 family insertion sequence element accessory protein TnpA n=5 Tax=Vibrionaceae TaxID=641 RepID=UPI0015C52DDF|nr:IS66 family insertion sequence element accessory protein TnpB [Vibrio aestuarianus]MDE1339808.1 IS66 family insertion sequence element accessory protein TnpB [Vibrio aestuarianus]NGZ68774.1 IS66 family insertion sequence element accessory protein TnpB [Vibrio aestuarianus subsp. cardii]